MSATGCVIELIRRYFCCCLRLLRPSLYKRLLGAQL